MEDEKVFKISSLPSSHVFRMDVPLNGTVTPLGGVEFRFLKLLAGCMNFKYKILIPDDGEFGRKKEDGEWTGMIGMAKRGEADFGLNMIALTSNRNEAVNFSYPYMIDGTTFFTEVPAALPKTLAYFYPFGYAVWLCLILVLITTPIAFRYILLKRYPLSRLYLEIFGNFFQQPLGIKLTKFSQKIMCASWFFFARFATLCYTVVLLSFVAIPLMSRGLYSVNQVAQASAKGTHKCYIFSGTADQDAFYSATDGPLATIGKFVKKYNRLVKHGAHIKQYIQDSKSVLIGSNTLVVFNYMDGVYQNYYVSKDFFYITLFSIPVKENFCCLKQMNKCIHRSFSAGLYQKFMKDEVYMLQSQSYFMQEYEMETDALELYDISGALVILLCGYSIAGLTLCAEIFYSKHQKHGVNIEKHRVKIRNYS